MTRNEQLAKLRKDVATLHGLLTEATGIIAQQDADAMLNHVPIHAFVDRANTVLTETRND